MEPYDVSILHLHILTLCPLLEVTPRDLETNVLGYMPAWNFGQNTKQEHEGGSPESVVSRIQRHRQKEHREGHKQETHTWPNG